MPDEPSDTQQQEQEHAAQQTQYAKLEEQLRKAHAAQQTQYAKLEEQLRKAPGTWVPVLLSALVARAVTGKDVFKPGGVVPFVRKAVERAEMGDVTGVFIQTVQRLREQRAALPKGD